MGRKSLNNNTYANQRNIKKSETHENSVPERKQKHIRPTRTFSNIQLRVERLQAVKPKGLRALFQTTSSRFVSKNGQEIRKDKNIDKLEISDHVRTFRKRSSKSSAQVKPYETFDLKNLINTYTPAFDLEDTYEEYSVVEVYSVFGELWRIRGTLRQCREIHDEIR